MIFLPLLLCSTLAAFTTAATLAADLPDGVYYAYTDERGLETHTRLNNDELSPRTWTLRVQVHYPKLNLVRPLLQLRKSRGTQLLRRAGLGGCQLWLQLSPP